MLEIAQPFDITLKAFQTKYVRAAEYMIGKRKDIYLLINLSYGIYNSPKKRKLAIFNQ